MKRQTNNYHSDGSTMKKTTTTVHRDDSKLVFGPFALGDGHEEMIQEVIQLKRLTQLPGFSECAIECVKDKSLSCFLTFKNPSMANAAMLQLAHFWQMDESFRFFPYPSLYGKDGIIRISKKGDSKDTSLSTIYWIDDERTDLSNEICPDFAATGSCIGTGRHPCPYGKTRIQHTHGAGMSLCRKIMKAAELEGVYPLGANNQLPCPYFNSLHRCYQSKSSPNGCPFHHDSKVQAAFLKHQTLFVESDLTTSLHLHQQHHQHHHQQQQQQSHHHRQHHQQQQQQQQQQQHHHQAQQSHFGTGHFASSSSSTSLSSLAASYSSGFSDNSFAPGSGSGASSLSNYNINSAALNPFAFPSNQSFSQPASYYAPTSHASHPNLSHSNHPHHQHQHHLANNSYNHHPAALTRSDGGSSISSFSSSFFDIASVPYFGNNNVNNNSSNSSNSNVFHDSNSNVFQDNKIAAAFNANMNSNLNKTVIEEEDEDDGQDLTISTSATSTFDLFHARRPVIISPPFGKTLSLVDTGFNLAAGGSGSDAFDSNISASKTKSWLDVAKQQQQQQQQQHQSFGGIAGGHNGEVAKFQIQHELNSQSEIWGVSGHHAHAGSNYYDFNNFKVARRASTGSEFNE